MAKFSNMEVRELILTYYNTIIKKGFLSRRELKEAIIKSFNLGGIDESQEVECFCAFNITDDLENLSKANYTKKDIQEILNYTYKEKYINELDYFIFSYYLVIRGLMSSKLRTSLLNDRGIKLDLVDSLNLKMIIKELEAM